ncbi:hypothetical protein PIB30_069035 [Stylosanthes scabra]|uniref:Reverse transcriptase zinc-binding domain-containing protein n=1 Tax=Stylosanthes scabra TaxID=79078 RepID=A0ABU6TNT0_9FABA|nr:hypothetical protein [Stylosanthes scabra]
MFIPTIATAILQLQLEDLNEDTVTWAPDKRGCYNVAFGHHLAFQLYHPPIDLLLKAFHNRLSVRHHLKSRIPTVVDTCPRCGNLRETLLHCLVTCPFAVEAWNSSNLPSIDCPDPVRDFWTWRLRILEDVKWGPVENVRVCWLPSFGSFGTTGTYVSLRTSPDLWSWFSLRLFRARPGICREKTEGKKALHKWESSTSSIQTDP